MSEADKMFEELGYEKHENKYAIYFTREYNSIRFGKENLTICTTGLFKIQELKAINEKYKELGWLDNDEQHISRID